MGGLQHPMPDLQQQFFTTFPILIKKYCFISTNDTAILHFTFSEKISVANQMLGVSNRTGIYVNKGGNSVTKLGVARYKLNTCVRRLDVELGLVLIKCVKIPIFYC